MPDPETHNILISISAPDRVGLISAVTAALFDLGLNLGDTSFAVLGSGCEFTCVAQGWTGITVADVERELGALEVLSGAEIKVSGFRFELTQTEAAKVTHRIIVSGGDSPGFIARMSEVFVEFDANVVRMNSTRTEMAGGPAVYQLSFDISIPPLRAKACIAAVGNTAGQLNLDCACRELAAE